MAAYFRMIFEGALSGFRISFGKESGDFGLSFGEMINAGQFPLYDGKYEVTPKIEAQQLKTTNRSMEQDVTVHAIPYYEVDNEYNGQTIVIGGN